MIDKKANLEYAKERYEKHKETAPLYRHIDEALKKAFKDEWGWAGKDKWKSELNYFLITYDDVITKAFEIFENIRRGDFK